MNQTVFRERARAFTKYGLVQTGVMVAVKLLPVKLLSTPFLTGSGGCYDLFKGL